MAKMTKDAYTRENTKGKVSTSGAMNEGNAIIEAETNMTNVERIIESVKTEVAGYNAKIEIAYEEGKAKLMNAFEQDSTYQARYEATEGFTMQWCESLRKDGTADEDYIRTEVFGRRTLHAYKFNVEEATFTQIVSMWNSATNVVEELRAKKLEAARKAAEAKRKAEEAEKAAKDAKILKLQTLLAEKLGISVDELSTML